MVWDTTTQQKPFLQLVPLVPSVKKKEKKKVSIHSILSLRPAVLVVSLARSLRRPARLGRTGEATLALLLAAGDGQELVCEQVERGGAAVRVRLEAAQDKSLGLQRHGLRDLRVDLKHAHLWHKAHVLQLNNITSEMGMTTVKKCSDHFSSHLIKTIISSQWWQKAPSVATAAPRGGRLTEGWSSDNHPTGGGMRWCGLSALTEDTSTQWDGFQPPTFFYISPLWDQ